MIPKAEIHCHIEGAAHPDLVIAKAHKYKVDISQILDSDNRYQWNDFSSFIRAYDLAASLFRSPDDYHDLARDVFLRMAADGCIYGEIFTSSDHAQRMGCSGSEMIHAVATGIEAAKQETGIEGRIIATGVRHEGVEAVEAAALEIVNNPHPMVTGFGIAGDERAGNHRDFSKAFDIVREAGYGLTGHAGELLGPESVREALDHWGITRIGHGVRAIEDENLVRRIVEEGLVLEVCPGSNIALKVYPDFQTHPFPKLRDAGCIVTLSSDDPPYFHTTIAREYEIAREYFGSDEGELLTFTRNAIEAAFVDGETKVRLLEKCNKRALD